MSTYTVTNDASGETLSIEIPEEDLLGMSEEEEKEVVQQRFIDRYPWFFRKN